MMKSRKVDLESKFFSWTGEKEARLLVKALGADACRFVGGVVRDSVCGRPIKDIDVATTLTPETLLKALENADIKAIPTGLKHGTITAVFNDRSFEITTLRHDVKTFGRHADVAFHDDWEADAARRDFTINALYLSPDGMLYDYHDGEQDLNHNLVRFIGDAEKRIKEDALRILRFFRFHAWYGTGNPNAAAMAAIGNTLGLLETLSAERIRNELLKTIAAPDPAPVMKTMSEMNILGAIFENHSPRIDNFSKLIDLENAVGAVSALRRLSALVIRDKNDASFISKKLKLSGKQQTRLVNMVDRPLPKLVSEKTAAKEIYASDKQSFIDRLILKGGKVSEIQSLIKFANSFKKPVLPIKGADLEKAGIKPGVEMGKILKDMEIMWIESDFVLSTSDLLKVLK